MTLNMKNILFFAATAFVFSNVPAFAEEAGTEATNDAGPRDAGPRELTPEELAKFEALKAKIDAQKIEIEKSLASDDAEDTAL